MAARRGPATRGKSEPQGQLAATTTSFGCSAGLSFMDVTKPQLFGVMDHVAPIDGPEVELEEPLRFPRGLISEAARLAVCLPLALQTSVAVLVSTFLTSRRPVRRTRRGARRRR